MQPFNYFGPQIDLGAKFARLGETLQQNQQQKRAEQAAQSGREQYQNDLQSAFSSGDPRSFAMLAAKYPQQREAITDAWGITEEAQKNERFGQIAEVYTALQANPEVARELIQKNAEADRNSGGSGKSLESLVGLVDKDPEGLKNKLAFTMSLIDPDKWSKIAEEKRADASARPELQKKQAEASKASIASDFAQANAVIDLQKKGWDISKIENDINVSKQNQKIAAIDARLKKEQNETKRAELELKKNQEKSKRDQTIRENAAQVETARANIDNMLNSIDEIAKTPESTLNDALGAFDASFVGEALDVFDQDVQDFNAKLDTITNQAFLAQLPNMKGFGALTDKEGPRLINSLKSFSKRQSKPQFVKNLTEIQRLLNKMRANLKVKHGVPETVADRPEAVISNDEMAEFTAKYLNN